MKLLTKAEQVYKEFKKQLIAGIWKLGDKIPSENELIDLYGVGRSTVREVLNMLSVEGIIEKKHGLGSYITRIPLNIGTIVVFVRLEHISSPSCAFWYKNLVLNINESARKLGYDVTIVTGYGKTISQVKESVMEFFNKLMLNEIVAIINLMDIEIPHLGYPTIDLGVDCSYSQNAVILDFGSFYHKAKDIFSENGYDKPYIFYVNDSTDKSGLGSYNKHESSINYFIDNDNSRKVSTSILEEIPQAFKNWCNSTNERKAILLVDDSICDFVSFAINSENIKVPEEVAIITHANVGRTFMSNINYHRLGFDVNIVVGKIFEILDFKLDNLSRNKIIKLDAIYQPGESI